MMTGVASGISLMRMYHILPNALHRYVLFVVQISELIRGIVIIISGAFWFESWLWINQ
jgi:hypothetical protein